MEVINALGRRKTAVARVYMSKGKGKISINKKEMADHIINFEKNNPNNEYNIIARDGGHAGVAYNDYWFNFIYKKYLDKNDNFRN